MSRHCVFKCPWVIDLLLISVPHLNGACCLEISFYCGNRFPSARVYDPTGVVLSTKKNAAHKCKCLNVTVQSLYLHFYFSFGIIVHRFSYTEKFKGLVDDVSYKCWRRWCSWVACAANYKQENTFAYEVGVIGFDKKQGSSEKIGLFPKNCNVCGDLYSHIFLGEVRKRKFVQVCGSTAVQFMANLASSNGIQKCIPAKRWFNFHVKPAQKWMPLDHCIPVPSHHGVSL